MSRLSLRARPSLLLLWLLCTVLILSSPRKAGPWRHGQQDNGASASWGCWVWPRKSTGWAG
jgi:hypothetical protein